MERYMQIRGGVLGTVRYVYLYIYCGTVCSVKGRAA